ncbi:DUF3500 domain-containing protein [soil metagenome]
MPHDGWHPHEHDEHGHHPQPRRRMVLAAATFLPFGGASAQTVDAAQRIADAANRFLAGLDEAQRKQAMIAFESGNRLDWHYIPRSRLGLALGEMKPAQRDAAHALFASVLNERGLQAIENVRIVEGVLREQQGSFRDPDRYYVSIFGAPSRFPWGWRLEGHHLSLNVALPSAGRITATPFFLGSHPATVRDGPHKGLRPLGAAEDLARQLMAALTEDQRRSAIIAERSVGEIVASPGRERDLAQPTGLALSAMDSTARNLVEALIDRFVGTLAPDLAAAQRQRVIEQELGRFRFAWAGPLAPGQAHYFRVHGPVTLIEHDNTQNNNNHIHSVWRDLSADFCNDALADHYRREKHR